MKEKTAILSQSVTMDMESWTRIRKRFSNHFIPPKRRKENAGLGLWIVKKEITKCNGKVYARSNDLNGVDLVIELPRREKR